MSETAPEAPVTAAPEPAPATTAPVIQADTDWKAEASKWKDLARKHEGRAQSNVDEITRQGSALAAIADKLGITIDGKPDADKLAAELDKSQKATRQTRAELAVFRAAATAGADADQLLDSRSFMSQVEGLDTSAADYGKQVTEAAKAWAEENPRYKAGQPAEVTAPAKAKPPVPRPSADFGAPAPNRQWTKADVDAATPAQLEKALAEGLLTDYGVGKTRERGRRH